MHVRRGKLEQREERMERVTAMEEFVFEAAVYIKQYGRRRLESRWCAKEPENTSDRYVVAVRKELS